jgi:hypothetical protein
VQAGKDSATGKRIIVPREFFQDSQVGKDFAAALKVTAGQLFGATNVGADLTLNRTAKLYAEEFDAYTRDLRTTEHANYNGFIAALSAAESAEERMKYKAQYDEIVKETTERTGQLRALQLQVKAYIEHPTTNGLISVGENVRDIIAASQRTGQAKMSPERVSDGIAQLRNDLLGNSEPPRRFWRMNKDKTGSVAVPLRLSGQTRITDNIDLTPFMQGPRRVKLTLRNVDSAGQSEFACRVKSDRPFEDGDPQGFNSKNLTHGAIVTINRSEKDDKAYYLAWRGETMTKEEFQRRYPKTEFFLELQP